MIKIVSPKIEHYRFKVNDLIEPRGDFVDAPVYLLVEKIEEREHLSSWKAVKFENINTSDKQKISIVKLTEIAFDTMVKCTNAIQLYNS